MSPVKVNSWQIDACLYIICVQVLKGVIWCDFKVLLSLWSVKSWLCIDKIPDVRACVRVCVWERERETVTSQRSVQRVRNCLNHGLFANTYEHHHCDCHATLFPSRAWTDAKTKDIINCLYFHFEGWSLRLWKGTLHFWHCLWCSANHNALGQLANQSRLCLSEGGTL